MAAETSLSEATTYAEMRTAVEAVTAAILTGSCGTDGDPCIDTEYINNKMSRIQTSPGTYKPVLIILHLQLPPGSLWCPPPRSLRAITTQS